MVSSENMRANIRLTAFGVNGEGEIVTPLFHCTTFGWAPVHTREFAPFTPRAERSNKFKTAVPRNSRRAGRSIDVDMAIAEVKRRARPCYRVPLGPSHGGRRHARRLDWNR